MNLLNSPTPFAWERRPNETSCAYAGFCTYRDLRTDRSLDKAYAHFCTQRGRKATRRPGYWSDWSTKYNWVERSSDYDDGLDGEKRAAKAERIRKLEERRCLFAVENQERDENLVRAADFVLESAFKTPISKVTQTKIDSVTGTETVTEVGGLDMGGAAKLWTARNKSAELAIKGVDAKEPEEEERQVDRIVWVTAPEKIDPLKDSDPDIPDHPGSGNVQPTAELDVTEEDSEEDDEDELPEGYKAA